MGRPGVKWTKRQLNEILDVNNVAKQLAEKYGVSPMFGLFDSPTRSRSFKNTTNVSGLCPRTNGNGTT